MSTAPDPHQPSWGPAPTAGPGSAPSAYGPAAPLSPADQRLWAALSHALTLVAAFVAPLVVCLVFRGRGAYLEHHAKESLNFQITMAIVAAVLGLFTLVTFGLGLLVTGPVAALLGLYVLVVVIVATVKGSGGEPYRYPLTLRLVR